MPHHKWREEEKGPGEKVFSERCYIDGERGVNHWVIETQGGCKCDLFLKQVGGGLEEHFVQLEKWECDQTGEGYSYHLGQYL